MADTWHYQVVLEGGLASPTATEDRLARTALGYATTIIDANRTVRAFVHAPPTLAATIAGHTLCDGYQQIRRWWVDAARPALLYLAGGSPYQGMPWADRAHAIAKSCLPDRSWGGNNPQGNVRPVTPPAPVDCCVCFEDLDDPLPTASWTSQAIRGMFDCRHALCRACDLRTQRSANTRCPMCRQPRRAWIQMRP